MPWSSLGTVEDAAWQFKLCGCWEWCIESLGVVLWRRSRDCAMLWNNAVLNKPLPECLIQSFLFLSRSFSVTISTGELHIMMPWLLCCMFLKHMKTQRFNLNSALSALTRLRFCLKCNHSQYILKWKVFCVQFSFLWSLLQTQVFNPMTWSIFFHLTYITQSKC